MFDGLPNPRLPEAPGIRNAPTLRQRPDDAETPPAQFHLPTTGIGRTARSHLGHPNRQTEARRPYENHHIRSSIAVTYSAA